MRIEVTAAALVLFALIASSCGGSSPVPGGSQDQQAITQPSDQTPDSPVPATDPEATAPSPEPAVAPEEIFDGVEYELVEVGGLGTVEMPVMDPADFVADDTEMPTILLGQLSPGTVVHSKTRVSATAFDNFGVNYVALYIDSQFLTANMGPYLEYDWETRDMADGMRKLQFVLRDAGKNIGICEVYVRIDNTTDWGPPEITIDSVHCTYGEYEFDPEEIGWKKEEAWNIAGRVELQASGWDASGIRQLTAYAMNPLQEGEDYYRNYRDPSKYRKIGHADGSDLYLTFDADSMQERQDMLLEAEDNAGEVTQHYFQLHYHTATRVYAKFVNRNGYSLGGVTLYLMPQDWKPAVSIDLSQAVASSVSTWTRSCDLDDVPLGLNYFVAVFNDETKVIPYLTLPLTDWNPILDEQGEPYVFGE